MKRYTIHEAKSQLSKLIQKALRGEEVIITNRHEAVAKLSPIRPRKRTLGFLGTGVWMSPDFNSPLDEFNDYQ